MCGVDRALALSLQPTAQLAASLRASAYPYVALLAFSGARTRLIVSVQVTDRTRKQPLQACDSLRCFVGCPDAPAAVSTAFCR